MFRDLNLLYLAFFLYLIKEKIDTTTNHNEQGYNQRLWGRLRLRGLSLVARWEKISSICKIKIKIVWLDIYTNFSYPAFKIKAIFIPFPI